MSTKKSRAELSPRPLIGVAKRQFDWKPSILGKFLAYLVKFCRKFLVFDASNTLKLYFYIVILCSAVSGVIDLPQDYYIVGKRNFFNVYFVKFSWFWTLLLLAPFLFVSSYVYSDRRWKNVFRQTFRLVVATVIWKTCTIVFDRIERYTAGCSLGGATYADESECSTKKGRWRSFEMSGHVFILTYIALITAEELSIFGFWQKMGDTLRNSTNYLTAHSVDENEFSSPDVSFNSFTSSPTKSDKSPLKRQKIDEEKSDVDVLYRRFGWLVAIFYVLNVFVSVLWIFMAIITSLYYHHFEQKFASFMVATVCWYLTYKIWYPKTYPGLPGYGKFKL